jgi:hypothetical protein
LAQVSSIIDDIVNVYSSHRVTVIVRTTQLPLVTVASIIIIIDIIVGVDSS